MIVILSGLENILQDLHDAATIDGVNELQCMVHVTVPLLPQVMAAFTLAALPLLLVYFLFQRQILRGMSMEAFR